MTREIPLTRGRVAIIDDDDYATFSVRKWQAVSSNANVYAYRGKGKTRVAMHRLIAGAEKGQVVDHINGDTLDNRRANLRLCSTRENCRNRKLNRNNTSGYKGVYWSAPANKWVAQIREDGRVKRVGQFETIEDAARAYDAAAIAHYGDFARPNFPVDPLASFAPRRKRT